MIFLYSGSQSFNTPQTDPEKSLGGFLSSSIIPNGSLNSIFSETSQLSLEKGLIETKGIFLKNTTGALISNIKFGFVYPPNSRNLILKLEAAFAAPNSSQAIESIATSKSLPYIGNFSEPYFDDIIPVDASVNIGDLADQASIGIWLKRTIFPSTLQCDDLKALYDDPQAIPSVLVTGIRLSY